MDSEYRCHLKLCTWNGQGFASKRNNKLKNPEFIKLFNIYDMVLCTETWTNETSTMDIAGFDCLTLHRARRAGAKTDSGGIVVYFRSKLSSYVELIKTTEDCIV